MLVSRSITFEKAFMQRIEQNTHRSEYRRGSVRRNAALK
jgi:hypothetical protein